MNRINSITKACRVTDSIFSKVIANFNRFTSEKEIACFILAEIKTKKLKPAFPPIVSMAGLRYPAEIHHKPLNRWSKGFCIIDMGVIYNGYRSDMTRMVYIGKPTTQELKLYNFLLKVQQKDIANAKPGKTAKELAGYNKKLLGKYFKYQYHGLGHGVGRKIHEKPTLSLRKKVPDYVLQKGDVITIEPGIYFSRKFGIRIEDTIVIGGKVLTRSSKKLIIYSQ